MFGFNWILIHPAELSFFFPETYLLLKDRILYLNSCLFKVVFLTISSNILGYRASLQKISCVHIQEFYLPAHHTTPCSSLMNKNKKSDAVYIYILI